jgi:hypothetical protein
MQITVATLRAAGCSETLINRIVEIADQENTAKNAAFNIARCRAYRERKAQQKQRSRHARHGVEHVASIDNPQQINGSETGMPIAQESLLLTNSVSKKDSIDAHRIAVNWKPTAADRDWSLKHGMTLTEIQDQAERFFDYWKALGGQRARKTDWAGTWRNWCRKFLDDNPRQASFIPPTQQAEYDAENERNKIYWLKVLAEEKKNGTTATTRAELEQSGPMVQTSA